MEVLNILMPNGEMVDIFPSWVQKYGKDSYQVVAGVLSDGSEITETQRIEIECCYQELLRGYYKRNLSIALHDMEVA